MRDAARWIRLLSALWLGILLAVAGIAAPAPFVMLDRPDAGRVAGYVLGHEAWLSLLLGVALLVLVRARTRRHAEAGHRAPQFTSELAIVLGAVFCTVVGYFAIQPMMVGARSGAGHWSFGQLHVASTAFFALKVLLVGALAWRTSGALVNPSPSSSG